MPTESNYHVGVSVSDLAAWVAAVVANGGSVSSGRETTVGILIDGLKTDSLWTKLDRLWLFAAENEPSAKTDIKALVLATAVNTPTFTTDQDYTFNGTTNYIDTLFAPSTAGGVCTLNSAHMGLYMRTAPVTTSGYAGAFDSGGASSSFIISDNGSNRRDQVQDGGGALLDSTTGVEGMQIITRTGATARASYSNGSNVASDAQVSTFQTAFTFFCGARNTNGSPSFSGAPQIAAMCLGSGLNNTEASNLSSRINTYMTAVGANVY